MRIPLASMITGTTSNKVVVSSSTACVPMAFLELAVDDVESLALSLLFSWKETVSFGAPCSSG